MCYLCLLPTWKKLVSNNVRAIFEKSIPNQHCDIPFVPSNIKVQGLLLRILLNVYVVGPNIIIFKAL
jgi:hypothetical protein